MSRVPLPLAQVVLSALNHVLGQQPALRDTLRAHAGRVLRITVSSPLPAAWTPAALQHVDADARIGDDGLLAVVTGAVPAATLTVTPGLDAIAGLLRAGPAGLGSHLRIEGDVMVAAAIGQVARAVRWDAEEDLSRLTGDVIAHRIGRGVRGAWSRVGTWNRRGAEAAQRVVTTGSLAPLVPASAVDAFADELQQLSARIGALEAGAARFR